MARVHAALLEGNDESLDVARRVPSQHATISLSDIKSRGTLYARHHRGTARTSHANSRFPSGASAPRRPRARAFRFAIRGDACACWSTMRLACVFATLALLLGAASADAPDDWLREWLSHLTVAVPDQKLSAGGLTVALTGVTCDGFAVDSVSSSANLPRAALTVGVRGAACGCSGSWSVRSMSLRGRLSAEVSDSDASLTLALSPADARTPEPRDAPPTLPANATARACASTAKVTRLDFAGSGAAALRALAPLLKTAVAAALDDAACATGAAAAADALSDLMRAARAPISRALRPPKPLPSPDAPPSNGATRLDWRVSSATTLARVFLAAALEGSTYRRLAALFEAENGALRIPDAALPTFAFASDALGGTTFAVAFRDVEVRGADDVASISGPVARGPTRADVDVGAGFEWWNVTATVRVRANATVRVGEDEDEEGEKDTRARDVGAEARVSARVKSPGARARLAVVARDDFFAESVRVLDASFEGKLTTIEIRAGGSNPGTLESDADALVGNVASLLAGRYGDAVTAAASAALGGPGRDAINALAADALSRRRANDDRHAGGKRNGGDGDANDGGDGDANDVVSALFAGFAACCVVVAAAGAAGATFFAARGETRRSSTAFPPPSSTAFPPPSSSRASTDLDAPLLRVAPEWEAYEDDGSRDGDLGPVDLDGSGILAGVAAVDLEPSTESDPSPSLGRAAIVPLWVRIALPAAIVGNVALFISSNASVGATVRMYASVSGSRDRVDFPPLHEFSLGSSVRDMWRAGTYPLSILIAVFSGGWPYLKLAVMLFAWFAPPARVHPTRRGRMLAFVDAFGKWSLVDAFVMILFRVAFRFTLATPKSSDGESVRLDVDVEANWGFHSFVLATVASLALGHVALAWHREATAEDEAPSEDVEDDRVDEGNRSRRRSVVVAGTLALAAALTLVGAFVTSIRFEFGGLTGALLGARGARRDYSLVSLAARLPPGSASAAAAWIFAVAMPLASVAACAALEFAPATIFRFSTRRTLEVTAGVTRAWAALDVFLVAALAAVAQIRRFASFVVGDSCDAVNAAIRIVNARAKAKGWDDLDARESLGLPLDVDACFDVRTELDAGCWVLVAAAAAAAVGGWLVAGATRGDARVRKIATPDDASNDLDVEREVETLLGAVADADGV